MLAVAFALLLGFVACIVGRSSNVAIAGCLGGGYCSTRAFAYPVRLLCLLTLLFQ